MKPNLIGKFLRAEPLSVKEAGLLVLEASEKVEETIKHTAARIRRQSKDVDVTHQHDVEKFGNAIEAVDEAEHIAAAVTKACRCCPAEDRVETILECASALHRLDNVIARIGHGAK